MASATEPEGGILDVFKFAAHALDNAPSLDYISSDSNEDSAERVEERPAISKSCSNSSGTSSHESSSCGGSSYSDESSGGLYRMEYHDFGNHSALGSCDSGSEDDEAYYEEGDALDLIIQRLEGKEASAHSMVGRIADALFMATAQKETVVELTASELEDEENDLLLANEGASESEDVHDSKDEGSGAVEVTAEDSFRKMRKITIASDAEDFDHRGHRRHASSPVFHTTARQEEEKEVQMPLKPSKIPKLQLGKPPLPTTPRTPRSTRFQTGTPTSVSMAGVGMPSLKSDEQGRKSSFSLRVKLSPKGSTGSSPSGRSRSSSFSFGFPSPKSFDSFSKPDTPKKTHFAESTTERRVSRSFSADPHGDEEREQNENECRGDPPSQRERRTSSPAPVLDSTSWQWGSEQGREQPERIQTPQSLPGRAKPRVQRIAFTEPERSVVHEKGSSPRFQEEEIQLHKVAKTSPRTPLIDTTPTKKKERFSSLFRSPPKQEHEHISNSESKTEPVNDPVEPSTATEAAEMITNLLKLALKAGEDSTKPSEGEETSSTNVENATTSTTSSSKKKKERFSKFFRSKKDAEARNDSIDSSQLGAKELPEEEPNSASEAVEMISNLFQMSLQPVAEKTNEVSKSTQTNTSSGVVGDKEKSKKGSTSKTSHMSFFGSSKKEETTTATEKEDEAPAPMGVVEEKPADIYELTNWLWTPFMFPTDESGVGPNDEPIVVLMDDDEGKNSKKRTKDKKGLRPWAKGEKSGERSTSSEEKKKTSKKKESKRFIASRAAKDSSSRKKKQVDDTVIIQDDHDNFIPSTRAWSQPMSSPTSKEKRGGKKSGGIRKSLKSRILGRKNKSKAGEMDSGDINIVSFANPKGKGQEMMLMTDSVSKKLHKRSKSHKAFVNSLYEIDD